MAARTVRRTFATPLVVTLASGGCFVDRPPPPVYHNPPPQEEVAPPQGPPTAGDPYAPAPTTTQQPSYVQPGQPAPPSPPSPYVQPGTQPYSASPTGPQVVVNPPPPIPPTPQQDRRWTISRSINQCLANLQYACPAPRTGAPPCVPPSPTLYTCPPDLPDSATMIIYQRAGEADCYVLPAPVSCPPNVMCNPPPPRKAICPQ